MSGQIRGNGRAAAGRSSHQVTPPLHLGMCLYAWTRAAAEAPPTAAPREKFEKQEPLCVVE